MMGWWQHSPADTDWPQGSQPKWPFNLLFMCTITHFHSVQFALACSSFVQTNSQHGEKAGETWFAHNISIDETTSGGDVQDLSKKDEAI